MTLFIFGWKTGLEPATSGTTIQRSNQLSYNHHLWRRWVSNPLLWIFSPAQSPDLPRLHYFLNKKIRTFLKFGLVNIVISKIDFYILFESNTLSVPNWLLNHLFDLLKCLCVLIVLIISYILKRIFSFCYFS